MKNIIIGIILALVVGITAGSVAIIGYFTYQNHVVISDLQNNFGRYVIGVVNQASQAQQAQPAK